MYETENSTTEDAWASFVAAPVEPAPLGVLLLDDHPAVRWGLTQLIEDQPDMRVASVATTAETAIGQAEHERIDVAIVDYHLGGRNGLWVTRKLKDLALPPRVVIFSAFADDHLAASCVVAGADAMLSKGSLGDELCNTIRAVAKGRKLLPRVPTAVADTVRERLDAAEEVTFGMLLAGITREEIVRVLSITEEELRSRERRMLDKLEWPPGEAHRADAAGAPRSRRG